MKRLLLPLAALALLAPAQASAQEEAQDQSQAPEQAQDQNQTRLSSSEGPRAKVRIALKNVNGSRVHVGSRILGVGYVRPFVPNQEVRVWVSKANNEIVAKRQTIRRVPGKNQGRFKIRSKRLIADGSYRVRAKKEASPNQEGFSKQSRAVGISYPDLDPGQQNNDVGLFNNLLDKQAYYTSNGSSYGSATGPRGPGLPQGERNAAHDQRDAVDLPDARQRQRQLQAEVPGRRQARRGRPLPPGDGPRRQRQAEAHLPHLLGNGRDADDPGATTPSSARSYGTNSHGMVYSVYFGPTNRGYATHGYKLGPELPREPRLPAQPDPELALHLQLDQHRRRHLRLPVAPRR